MLRGILTNAYKYQPGNFDYISEETGLFRQLWWLIQDSLESAAGKMGFNRGNFNIENSLAYFEHFIRNLDDWEEIYQLFRDEYSRNLFVNLLLMRILGDRHIKLPVNRKEYWSSLKELQKAEIQRKSGKCGRFKFNLYQIPGQSGVIRLSVPRVSIQTIFKLEQYAYRRGITVIAVEPGDIVIDGGGCWGDSALCFADLTGSAGKVHCFEFEADNLQIMGNNCEMNPDLCSRREVCPYALAKNAGEKVRFTIKGPASSIAHGIGDADKSAEATTISLDYLLEAGYIPRVDFIKLDIEGAELSALQGAEKALRHFRPKLAVSIYHNAEQYISIAKYLNNLNIGSRFYLDHYTLHSFETILYAIGE